jgi:hypothetical protein
MARLLFVAAITLMPLPAAAAGDEPAPAAVLVGFYLVFGYLAMAFGYGFSAMRARPAIVGALGFTLILFGTLCSIYGLQKGLQALFMVGAAAFLLAPMLALGVYLGRRSAKRALARKLATSHGN